EDGIRGRNVTGVQTCALPICQLEDVDPRTRALSGYIARYGPWPAWKDTAVEYFSSGEAMFPRLLEDLRRAKKFIFLETFIIRPEIGRASCRDRREVEAHEVHV